MIASVILEKLWKRKMLIALFVAVALLICHFGLFVRQNYTAAVYIKYTENTAVDGISTNGQKLDPYEITQPYVIIKALEQMGVTTKNVNSIAQRISVTPVVSIAEQEKYAAWIDNFTDYEEDTEEGRAAPVYYRIEFKANEGVKFAQSFLSALIQQYRNYYTEKYVGFNEVSIIPEAVILDSDYYQSVEKMYGQIKQTINYLDNIVTSDTDYRSSQTGYSLDDLIDMYHLFIETEIAPVAQYILDTGVSKDVATLVAALKQSSDTAQRDSDENERKANTQKQMMLLYADKNDEYVSTVINSEDYDDQIKGDVERDKAYVRNMTTYDQLMLDYVDYAVKSGDLLIDKAYIDANIEKFGDTTSTAGAPISEIASIYKHYAILMDITEQTLRGYNELQSGRVLLQVSGIQINENLPDLLYYTVSVIFSFALGCVYVISREFINLKKTDAKQESTTEDPSDGVL